MKAIVIGASGATGSELVRQLLGDPTFEEVVALVRRPYFEKVAKLTEVVVDFEKLEQYANWIQGDVAFSCLGTTLKSAGSKDAQWRVDHDYQLAFASFAKANGIENFVLLSSIGANKHAYFFYNRMKGALERAIQELGFAQLIILQPGGIERPDSNRFWEKIFIRLLKIFNTAGLFKKYAPIPTDRLAKAMIISCLIFKNVHKIVSLREIRRISE